ncbi:hypothetical protein NPIL_302761 [Nephila pilipes]|uniref:Uncharacterized protein n=1 Tax=Nephila pilipes TaxID=299642 RepID=A0A8X6TMT7_NEPPI|nr:hypothetical protein NPIL_302761 [Nephila pilipes]
MWSSSQTFQGIQILESKSAPWTMTPVFCCMFLCAKEKCMSIQHVRKWLREFKDGRTDINDQEHFRQSSVSDETIVKAEEALVKDRRMTDRDLFELMSDVNKS